MTQLIKRSDCSDKYNSRGSRKVGVDEPRAIDSRMTVRASSGVTRNLT